jgi:hypothetical protein
MNTKPLVVERTRRLEPHVLLGAVNVRFGSKAEDVTAKAPRGNSLFIACGNLQ